MKIRPNLLLALLAIPMFCLAEEPNPFVKKKDETKAKEAPAGPGFVVVVEHILVPPDLIDDWLRHNAAPTDATAMRTEVQKWVNEGKATLDATVLASGVSGRACTSETTLELIYQTDSTSNGPGVWPMPIEFETRNTGYTQQYRFNPDVYPMRFSVEDELVEMTGSHSFHPLVEKTRLESDVFLPVIRSYRARSSSGDGSSHDVDPFTEPSASGRAVMDDSVPEFESGRVAWLARFDPLPEERKRAAMSRLIFARGEAVEKAEKSKPLPEEFMTSVFTVKIAHKDFSNWVQSQKPSATLQVGWQFVETLRQSGKAEVIDSGNIRCRSSKRNTLENISEYIYPTEFEPVNLKTVLDKWEKRKNQMVDGKNVDGVASYTSLKTESVPGLAGASIPIAFETRNTGRTYDIAMVPDGSGALVQLVVEHVSLVGHSVHRRVEDEEKWVPDVTMPLFSRSAPWRSPWIGTVIVSALMALVVGVSGIWLSRQENRVVAVPPGNRVDDAFRQMARRVDEMESLWEKALDEESGRLLNDGFQLPKNGMEVVGVIPRSNLNSGFSDPGRSHLREDGKAPQLRPVLEKFARKEAGEWVFAEGQLPDGSGWIEMPEKPLAWCRGNGRSAVVLILDPRQAAEVVKSDLQSRFNESGLTEEPGSLVWNGPGGTAWLASGKVVDDSKPDEILRHVSRFGDWTLRRFYPVRVVTTYRPPVLAGSFTLAALLLAGGVAVASWQRKAIRVAEERVSFVNRVSHELRTPLTNLLLNTERWIS